MGYVIVRPICSAPAYRTWLTRKLPWSDGVVVTQGEDIVRVLVQTDRPDLAVRAGLDCGPLEDIVINREAVRELAPAGLS